MEEAMLHGMGKVYRHWCAQGPPAPSVGCYTGAGEGPPKLCTLARGMEQTILLDYTERATS